MYKLLYRVGKSLFKIQFPNSKHVMPDNSTAISTLHLLFLINGIDMRNTIVYKSVRIL